MNCILAVRSDIKIKFGRRRFAAAHVQGLWQAGLQVPTPFAVPMVCHEPRDHLKDCYF
jgi:hypothetical protein